AGSALLGPRPRRRRRERQRQELLRASGRPMMRQFTGRHMAIVIVAFFGVVMAVNVLMATLAVRTFGGTVVDNSYVASQGYNRWLAEAKQQEALGWRAEISRTASGHVRVDAQLPHASVAGLRVTGTAIRPLGDSPERALGFRLDDDRFVSIEPLPFGRWLVHVTLVDAEGDTARFTRELAE